MIAPVSRKLISFLPQRTISYMSKCSKLRLVTALAFSAFLGIAALFLQQVHRSWKRNKALEEELFSIILSFKANLDFPRSSSTFSRNTPPNGSMANLAVSSSSNALFSANLVISLLSRLKDLQSHKRPYSDVLFAIQQTLLKVISKEIIDSVDETLEHQLYSTVLDSSNSTKASFSSPVARGFVQRPLTCRINRDNNSVEIREKDSSLLHACIKGVKEICKAATFSKSFSIFDANFIKQLPSCLSGIQTEKLQGALIEVSLMKLALGSSGNEQLLETMKLNKELCPCFNRIIALGKCSEMGLLNSFV